MTPTRSEELPTARVPHRGAGDRHENVSRAFASDYASLCRLAYLMTGSAAQAEEIVMDVFTATLRAWRSHGDGDALAAYLRRAVINRSRSHGRRRTHERALYEVLASRPGGDVAEHPDVATEQVVLAAVRALPPRQQAAVLLTYYLDLSGAEVAAALGCSAGTVKSQLSKARASLAATLDTTSEDDHA